MTCFYHNRLSAVGVCKYCNKGLCEKCAVDLGVGLACINKCENQVKVLSELMEKAIKTYKNQANLYLRYSVLMFALGFFFLTYGYYYAQLMLELFGCVSGAVGVIYFLHFKKQK